MIQPGGSVPDCFSPELLREMLSSASSTGSLGKMKTYDPAAIRKRCNPVDHAGSSTQRFFSIPLSVSDTFSFCKCTGVIRFRNSFIVVTVRLLYVYWMDSAILSFTCRTFNLSTISSLTFMTLTDFSADRRVRYFDDCFLLSVAFLFRLPVCPVKGIHFLPNRKTKM